jgi:hypothetical protein
MERPDRLARRRSAGTASPLLADAAVCLPRLDSDFRTSTRVSAGTSLSRARTSKNPVHEISGCLDASAKTRSVRTVRLFGVRSCRPPRRSPGIDPLGMLLAFLRYRTGVLTMAIGPWHSHYAINSAGSSVAVADANRGHSPTKPVLLTAPVDRDRRPSAGPGRFRIDAWDAARSAAPD